MAGITITGVGLATAQGSAARVREAAEVVPPVPLPWPVRASAQARLYRPAQDVTATGMARLAELARRALAECGPRNGEPVVLASCNGGATTFERDDWRASFELGRALDLRAPVASAACASGIHALYLARGLVEAGAPSAIVLAADIATRPSCENFESLRIVDDELAPYQPEANGFMVGEAAVAVRIERGGGGVPLVGPVLGHDLADDDALRRVLAGLAASDVELVLGQATGPAAADRAELEAIAERVAMAVPLATASHLFGHALGASSLLSIALAALARDGIPRVLALPHGAASDGRALVAGATRAREVLVACRALGGACGAVLVGADHPIARAPRAWLAPVAPPPMRHPVLRALGAAARDHRPAEPPELLVVTLETPLQPPDDAWVGTRLLPSSVLELTPGFVAQLVARTWGHAGPAVTLVGGDPAEVIAAARRTHARVCHVAIRGMDDHRDVDWNA